MKIIGFEYTEEKPPFRVDRWYDRKSRSWVIQLKDEDNNQIGNSEFVGTKQEAINAEKRLKKENSLE